MSERFKIISQGTKKNKSTGEILKDLAKKFPNRDKSVLSFSIHNWRKRVGLAKGSTPFAKYLAANEYKIEEEKFDHVCEYFSMEPQEVKRETFKILSIYNPD